MFPFFAGVVADAFQVNDSVGADDPVLRDAEDFQRVGDITIGGQNREAEFFLGHERLNGAGVFVNVQRKEEDALTVLVLFDQLLEARQLLAAGVSRRGPEIQKHDLALQVGELPGFALEVGQLEGRQRILGGLPSEVRLIGERSGAVGVP